MQKQQKQPENTAKHGPTPSNAVQLRTKAAHRAVLKAQEAAALLEPTADAEVAQKLATVAAMLQSKLPPKEVRQGYIRLLSSYPPDLLNHACEAVIKKWKYPSFPKVADFIEEIKEEYDDRVRNKLWWQERINASAWSEPPPRSARGARPIGSVTAKIKEKLDGSHS